MCQAGFDRHEMIVKEEPRRRLSVETLARGTAAGRQLGERVGMESVFLGSFLFGLFMVLASVVLGFAHLALPGGDGGVHVGHDGGDAHGHGHGHGALPLWNVSSLLAFLTWFGAAGYVAMRFGGLTAPLALI